MLCGASSIREHHGGRPLFDNEIKGVHFCVSLRQAAEAHFQLNSYGCTTAFNSLLLVYVVLISRILDAHLTHRTLDAHPTVFIFFAFIWCHNVLNFDYPTCSYH